MQSYHSTLISGTFRIAIVGSRTINDYSTLLCAIGLARSELSIPYNSPIEIVSGGAKGIDSLASRYARDNGYRLTVFLPKYISSQDRCAPLRRNTEIAQYSNVMIAIWDGKSTGTKHVIGEMARLNKPYYIYMPRR